MAKQFRAAVMSADIVGSTSLKPQKRKELQKLIDSFFAGKKQIFKDLRFEQFRGDSMQIVLTDNKKNALKLALELSTFLKISNFEIRIAIGLGEISYDTGRVVTSDGTAFQLSGPAVDELKKRNDLIDVKFDLEVLNDEWETNNNSMNFILKKISSRQAEATYLALEDLKQEEIAKKLKISQPSVHHRLKTAGADVFYSMIRRFETVVEKNY